MRKPSSAESSRHNRSAQPLALHLFTLILFVLLPCLLFSVVLLIRNDNARRDLAYSRAETVVASVAESFHRETERMRYLLQVLSTKGALRTGDLAALHADARVSLAGSNTHFLVLDQDYNQLLNTRVEFGAPLGKGSNTDTLDRSRTSGEITLSGLFFGRTSGEIVFNMSNWIQIDEETGLYLVLTQNARDLFAAVETPVPQGWHYAVLDPNNQFATGSVDLTVGQTFPFPSDWIARNVGLDSDIVTHEQERYLVAATDLRSTGWKAMVWAPAPVVEAPLRRTWLLVVFAGFGLLLISIAAAAAGAHYLSRPIRILARDAHNLGEGQPVTAHDSNIIEIDQVSRELAHASHERARREEEIEFLLHEVSHRAKNQLSVISAITRQNLAEKDVEPDIVETLLARIQALAMSLDRLVGRNWQQIDLKALIETQLVSFNTQGVSRIRTNGPEVEIRPHAAQVLGLAIHELATNASKYGCLSNEAGYLTVSWAIRRLPVEEGEAGEPGDERPPEGAPQAPDAIPMLVIRWRESGGPPVQPPAKTGFGTRIIEDYLSQALGATVERRFEPAGFFCMIKMPADRLTDRKDASSRDAAGTPGSNSP